MESLGLIELSYTGPSSCKSSSDSLMWNPPRWLELPKKRYIRDGLGNARNHESDLLMIAAECVKACVRLPLGCSWDRQPVSWTPPCPAGVAAESLHCSVTNPKTATESENVRFTSSCHCDGSDLISFTIFIKQMRLSGAAIFTLFQRVPLEKVILGDVSGCT